MEPTMHFETPPEDLILRGKQTFNRLIERHELDFTSNRQRALVNIFGLSDFVGETAIRYPDCVDFLLDGKLEDEDYYLSLWTSLKDVEDESQLNQQLRRFRHIHMAKIALRDLNNQQPITSSLIQVSDLADALIRGAYEWLYDKACQRYGTPVGEHGPMPLLIMGMGKLGGRELNYSSDIDLIFAYPQSGEVSNGRKSVEHQQFYTKLAQKLINALHQTTGDGQVFRVDMRLRPFGESGPLVANFDALEDYYQDQGREWERYAMLKARIINGDSDYAEMLATILRPFVYRRYLDFGVIESLRSMKQLINQEVRRRGFVDNIKLGAGGIREVEFIVQSFQLIRGGREPGLQHPSLLDSLAELARLNAITAEQKHALEKSYLFLRKTEHCLQQFADQQTQLLPDNPVDRIRLAHVMSYADYDDFLRNLNAHMVYISGIFQEVIGEEEHDRNETPVNSQMADIWHLDLNEQEVQALLSEQLSENQASEFFAVVTGFRNGILRGRIGKRGLLCLEKLMPLVLEKTLANEQLCADALLPRILKVLDAIAGRTTYLQLMQENHGVLNQLISLCAASPWIAEQISRFPLLLDELINPANLYNPPAFSEYHSDLRQTLLRIDHDDLEAQMDALRQFKQSQQLRIAASDVSGALAIMKVSDHLTYLAEVIISEVVNLAWQQITEKYGRPEGKNDEDKGFAVIGYGKLGGIELGYGSDLDLVFIHDSDSQQQTDGTKAIDNVRFYTKLAQRIMHLFSTKTSSGVLYDIDMRLRPSGNSGLLVCHINGFDTYQHEDAWTWEHQALVRARFMYGTDRLRQRFDDIRQAVLSTHRVPQTLASEVREMREKMRSHLSQSEISTFDVKQDKGGIADVEFLVQFWILNHANQHPSLCKHSDNVRQLDSLLDCHLISQCQAQTLKSAYLMYRNSSHKLALQQRKVIADADAFADVRTEVSEIWESVFGK